MKKIISIGIIGMLLLSFFMTASASENETMNILSDGNTLYVGGDGPGNYTDIQDAINDSSNGDTIFVYSGAYNVIFINRSISIIGEDKENTIIDGNGGNVIDVVSDWVNISGFTIQNGNLGIFLYHVSNNTITNNNIEYNEHGIGLLHSDHNTIIGNNISNNAYGIFSESSNYNSFIDNNVNNNENCGIALYSFSNNNTITDNTITNNDVGIGLESYCNHNTIIDNSINGNEHFAIVLDSYCSNNAIMCNTIMGSTITSQDIGILFHEYCNHNTVAGNIINNVAHTGIYLYFSNNNLITDNNLCEIRRMYCSAIYMTSSNNNHITYNRIIDSHKGITLDNSSDNLVYRNNLINNTENAYDNGNNIWHNETLEQGNYYDDYTEKYPDAEPLNDVWDTPYNITGGSNKDYYPLMKPYGSVELAIEIAPFGFGKISVLMSNVGNFTASDVNWNISVKGGILKLINISADGTIETIDLDSSEKVTTGSNSVVKRFGNVEVVVEVEVGPYSFKETFYGFVIGRIFIDRSLYAQG